MAFWVLAMITRLIGRNIVMMKERYFFDVDSVPEAPPVPPIMTDADENIMN
jgi:hypothetical protein